MLPLTFSPSPREHCAQFLIPAMRFLLDRPRRGSGRARHLLHAHPRYLHHQDHFTLAFGQRIQQAFEFMSARAHGGPTRSCDDFGRLRYQKLASFQSPAPPERIQARVPCNRKNPRQQRLGCPIRMARPVDPHPAVLQHVFRIALRLSGPAQKPQQPGRETRYQFLHRARFRALIPNHQLTEVFFFAPETLTGFDRGTLFSGACQIQLCLHFRSGKAFSYGQPKNIPVLAERILPHVMDVPIGSPRTTASGTPRPRPRTRYSRAGFGLACAPPGLLQSNRFDPREDRSSESAKTCRARLLTVSSLARAFWLRPVGDRFALLCSAVQNNGSVRFGISGAAVTLASRAAKNHSQVRLGAAAKKEIAQMHLGYWLQFWWMFPVALAICVTV